MARVPDDDQSNPLLKAIRDLADAVDRNTQVQQSGGGGAATASQRAASGVSGGFSPLGAAGGLAGGAARAVGGAALGAAGAVLDSTVGFAVNATLKAGRRALREAAIVGATNSVRLGDRIREGNGGAEAFGAAAETLPIFGQAVSDIRGPGQRAAQRLKGELGLAFRLGGGNAVSDDFLKSRFEQFRREETGAVEGAKRIDALAINSAGERDEATQILIAIRDGIWRLVSETGRGGTTLIRQAATGRP